MFEVVIVSISKEVEIYAGLDEHIAQAIFFRERAKNNTQRVEIFQYV